MTTSLPEDCTEIHLVVSHPSCGTFIARKLTTADELEDDYVDRAVNNLHRWLKNRGGWNGQEPAILVKRV